jgi:hypothetical protein
MAMFMILSEVRRLHQRDFGTRRASTFQARVQRVSFLIEEMLPRGAVGVSLQSIEKCATIEDVST